MSYEPIKWTDYAAIGCLVVIFLAVWMPAQLRRWRV